jgi:adenylosuccinate lyase
MSANDIWDNPLAERYASREMARLWSPQRKFSTWRRLWLALAEAQRELGLTQIDGLTPRIHDRQLEQMRAHLDDIDLAKADSYERRFRHDVMAHIHAFGDLCPEARPIIHLGATSCFVTDNADLMLMREGLQMLRDRTIGILARLAAFAKAWRDVPTLGFTHLQPAQLTTVGKRATLWGYDLVLDLEELEHRIACLRFRGVKGTTGTQASFLSLFDGNHEKVRQLDELVARKMGFERVLAVTGQTYSRKIDAYVLDTLSGLGQSASKFANDLRILQHRNEVEEPFDKEQVGSSAMAYKRNPMRCERICALARYLTLLPANAAQTAAVQWLERTLDDSANRRLVIPSAFLTADAIVKLYLNVAAGLVVHPTVIAKNVQRELPFMATENIMMRGVQRGGDRQLLHERIRQHSQAAAGHVKEGGDNDLLHRLAQDPAFSGIELNDFTRARDFVGRAPEQVDDFLQEILSPLQQRYGHLFEQSAEVHV